MGFGRGGKCERGAAVHVNRVCAFGLHKIGFLVVFFCGAGSWFQLESLRVYYSIGIEPR